MLTFIIGTSGSGKTTFATNYLEGAQEVVSITTRQQRSGEVEGVDYYFVDEATYQKLKTQGLLGESTVYAGNSYGITKDELLKKASNPTSYAVVDVHGYTHLKGLLQELGIDYQVIYFSVDRQTVKERLIQRGDSPSDIDRRMQQIEVDDINNKPLLSDPKCINIDASKSQEDMYRQYLALIQQRGTH